MYVPCGYHYSVVSVRGLAVDVVGTLFAVIAAIQGLLARKGSFELKANIPDTAGLGALLRVLSHFY